MCGIFGSESRPVTSRHLEAMKHRGPDSQRVVGAAGFYLGFARLAIVATESPRAEQPILSRHHHIIAFNGEIYNYKALRGSSDLTEIELLAALLEENIDPRQVIDGDYAIIDFNPSQRIIALYRDRFGMCPLYYQVRPYVAVSSERRHLGKHAQPVPPHGKVIISLNERRVTEWSAIPHYGLTCHTPGSIPHDSILRDLLLDAVESRATHTDTGFSLALSGGLDSSAVALACKALGLRPALAICAAKPDASDDRKHAELVAAKCGFDLAVEVLDHEKMRAVRPAVIEHLDLSLVTPLKWRASLRNWFVAQRSPTRVILCGEGADEMIEGYPPHTLRHAETPYRIAAHQLQALRALPQINLDRTNKLGLAHSKEFRAPFLASTLSYFLLSSKKEVGKQALRRVLAQLGAPPALLQRAKWGNDEEFLDASYSQMEAV